MTAGGPHVAPPPWRDSSCGAKLGLENMHPHRLRHTFATRAIQSGARDIDVQMLLGHSDLATVQLSAHHP